MTEYQNIKNILVGIDPDVDKSGVAVWNTTTQTFTSIQDLAFWDVIDFLLTHADSIKQVRIEAGWLIDTNWHTMAKLGKKGIAEMGRRVGRNHQVGLTIVEFCIKYSLPHKTVTPLKNNWWAEDGKKFKQVTGWQGQTNPEKRDAAMLVFGYK